MRLTCTLLVLFFFFFVSLIDVPWCRSPKTLRVARKPAYPRKSLVATPKLDKYSIVIHPLTTGAQRLHFYFIFFGCSFGLITVTFPNGRVGHEED